jgi:hypothetical protein
MAFGARSAANFDFSIFIFQVPMTGSVALAANPTGISAKASIVLIANDRNSVIMISFLQAF